VEDGLSQAMLGLLDGGARLEVPRLMRQKDKMLIAFRLGFTDILNGIVTNLPPKAAGGYQMMNGMVMAQTGLALDQIFGYLGGDVYLQMDMVRKEMEIPAYDKEADKMVTETRETTIPEFTVLIGLTNPQGLQEILANLAARMEQSTPQNQEPFMRLQTFNDVTTYIFGGNQKGTAIMPDPEKTIGLAVLGHDLCVGKWKDIVELIKFHAVEDRLSVSPLQEYIDKKPGANLISVTPRAFAEKMQKLNAEQLSSLGLDKMIKKWIEDDFNLPVDDPELETRLKESLVKCSDLAMKVLEKSQQRQPQDAVIVGKLYDDFYRLHSAQVMVFPEKAAGEESGENAE